MDCVLLQASIMQFAAREAGVSLDATTVLLVGDGRRQAALVKALPTIALELTFKTLVCRDAGETWLSYVDALRSRARGGVPHHGPGGDDRRHRK
jgi:hypothetical protein